MTIRVAEYPNPTAPGVSGSGKNWALGATAYIACWLVWIIVVFVLYELVYSFYRRWRVSKCLSSPLSRTSNQDCFRATAHHPALFLVFRVQPYLHDVVHELLLHAVHPILSLLWRKRWPP